MPTEIELDESNGLKGPRAASFDNLSPQLVAFLTERIGTIELARTKIGRALEPLADC